MADIEVKTNSSVVLSELKGMQNETAKLGNMIQTSNALSQQSFAALSGVLTGLLNPAATAMNLNIANGTLQWNMLSQALLIGTGVMMQNAAQTALSDAVALLYNTTVNQTQTEMTALSGSVDTNTICLAANMNQSLLNSQNCNLHVLALTAERAEIDSNTQSLNNNILARKGLNAYTSNLSPLNNFTGSLYENNDALEQNTLFIWAKERAEKALALMTAFNTVLEFASSVAKRKETIASIANAAASWREANAEKAAALGKVMSTAAGGIPGLVIAGVMMGFIAGALITFGAMNAFKGPALATGGVVSKPTMALVGEGRYSEAVVPLGDSPQFAEMKAGIASAVVKAMSGYSGNSRPIEVVVNLDSREIARATEKGNRLNSASKTATVGGVL